MSFADYTISSITDVPSNVLAFATARGWTVSDATLKAASGTMTFTISAAEGVGSGTAVVDTLTLTGPGGTTPSVLTSPRWPATQGVSASLAPIRPTKLMLHGDADWISISIAYGFNLYRHMYIGVIEKIGEYTGGDIISACNFSDNNYIRYDNNIVNSTSAYHAYLFRGHNYYGSISNCGGVKVNHADNPNQWRKFINNISYDNGAFDWDQSGVLGGYGDGVLESYLARGKMTFSNGVIMVPINLFATDSGNKLRPLGRVPGVRMVDMTNLDPETTFAIGSDNWRVIPAFGKYSTDGAAYVNRVPAAKDNSFNIGYAFKK